jgi:DNA-binding NarL/FixJ family response regulator
MRFVPRCSARAGAGSIVRRRERLSDKSYGRPPRCWLHSIAMSLLRAFIVEDSPVIRENLISALEELVPLQVVGWADDEAGALRWLADPANACDLVIIDLFLRAGSGTGILRELQAEGSKVDRVVLTNYAAPDVTRLCLQHGASRVFDKSHDIDALIAYCASLRTAA